MQISILSGDACFYVYEHLRQDTGAVFYVGKGRGRRARVANRHHRNEYWRRVEAKAGGFQIRYVANGLDEELALLAEVERIDQHRRLGAKLCNLTDGGEGFAGWLKTPEWRAKVGAAHRGKTVSPETRAKLSAAVKAAGYRHSEEKRRQMSEARRGRQNTLGMKHSEETKLKMSAAHKGNKGRTGQTRSAEERAKSSASLAGRKQGVLTCPHCLKAGGNVMRRFHFDHCRSKP